MSLDPEALYIQLGRIVESMPALHTQTPLTPEMNLWLGRAAALVEKASDLADAIDFKAKVKSLNTLEFRSHNAAALQTILYRALARAELMAPLSAQGAFIVAGAPFTAFAAVAKVFARAARDLLLVDGYADQAILTDYAITVPEGVQLRILTADKQARRLGLKPAAERWEGQFGTARPLAIRFVQASSLHDRLIIVDGTDAYVVGQSFNALAEKSHTSIVKADADLASMKVTAYEAMYQAGSPL